MTQSKSPIAFIGLGAMGFGMATNLVREGYQVTGFDKFQPILDRFRHAGGFTATTPAEAVAGKKFCVCMVATKEQAQDVLLDGKEPAIKAFPEGAVLFLCSTVPPGYVKGLERELKERNRSDIALIDCPVSGGAGRAADGTLSIMAGASETSIEKGLPILRAMSDSNKLYIIKGGIGAGSNMKMIHQVLAANQILSACEAMGLATRLNLDLAQTGQAIVKSDGWSWMFENRLPRMLDPDFGPLASAVTIILKDTSIITSEARQVKFQTPMTSTAEQAYFVGLGKGFGPDDDSSLVRLYVEGKEKLGSVKTSVKDEETKLALVINLLRGIHLCAAAEAITFGHYVGLDLEQVLEICVNAAGGSRMLRQEGQSIVDTLNSRSASNSSNSPNSQVVLHQIARQLQDAVDEAQTLKMPLFLGAQSLNLIHRSLRIAGEGASRLSGSNIISQWV
ncbi:hypothetical protein Plec18167_004249 [Paecilomyces lecythidis]|uniref:Oxidoreductase n=1 Tax=Paecilomyces lecythidis TaxID=3004212 RepID=A0ABR3XT99_9EURO